MIFQIQHFKIAELIFISSQNGNVTPSERREIRNRFESVVSMFSNHDKDYNAGFVKHQERHLPYNSISFIADKNNQTILHFSFSYKEPLFMIIDTKNNTVRNFVEISEVKSILNNKIFCNIKEDFLFQRYLNNRYKNIPDFNKFVEVYQEKIQEHTNKDAPTGTDCFEIDLDNF